MKAKGNNLFKDNFHGVLCHDGWIKVAKFTATAKVLNIQGKQVQVKGTAKSYICNVHKNLEIKFLEPGDTVGIKWNLGKPYIVAYRKQNFDEIKSQTNGDAPVSENMDWIRFFRHMDME